MIIGTYMMAIACTGIIVLLENARAVLAMKETSNVNEFMIENQKTHRRQNYVVQRRLNNNMRENMARNLGPAYMSDQLEPDTNPEGLPALIVDYANMIRNDIILLDDSIETRTSKRGNNVKTEVITDVPCNCGLFSNGTDHWLHFGSNYFPHSLKSKNCNKKLCPPRHSCQKTSYNVTVLKRKWAPRQDEEIEVELPDDLGHKWTAVLKPVVIGCFCTSDYIEKY